ncbi:MAG: hypothetical protein AUJ52_11870 [Elusimicrobia bacterium CG1_02_63_36]|nr:MAG: hypothetical protein AUJ52_11870 [Elusimicrobia bacterium CG1_02_63_36]PIP83761.1 MAG: hypothetical protein COR54_07875 [Elusimicrobia bacterium CG22_combo_CG10-13_8_21_14_all_63_91]PJA12022.1 MAG: hypothetical protein COX66_18265 [Elusimicrobia bacterium CG_4_10_14_0_2_um_filter_63_34]PJB25922.1 MAG: hypothetical protein CO113_06110 [Elusimicrobia bacterium CG_4_9_14_3_um_filter_62_55]
MRCWGRLALTALLLPAAVVAAPVVSVRRGAPADATLKSWFETLDRSLERADAAQARLAAAAARPAVRDALEAAGAVEAIAGDYAVLTGDEKGRADAAAFASSMRSRFSAVPPTDPLGKDALAGVFSLETPSLNRWIELLCQQALAVPGPDAKASANALAALEEDGETIAETAFLEVSPSDALSPAVRALLSASGSSVDPAASAVVSGARAWISKDGAALYGDFGAGGLIRLRMGSPGESALDQNAFYFITRALYELGFAVSVDNGVLEAALSGERLRLELDERVERFGSAWRAVETGRGLRAKLSGYLADSPSQEENASRVDALARIFAANGRLPMLELSNLSASVAAYRNNNDAREALRAELTKTLELLRLGVFPPDAPIGQRTLDLYYNNPVRAAVARGELISDGDAYRRSPRYRPLAGLGAPVAPRHRLYDWSAVFAAGRPIGRIGAAAAFRAQWRLDAGEWLILRYTRSAADGKLASLVADGRSLDDAIGTLSSLGLLKPAVEPRVRETFGRRGASNLSREAFGTALAPGSSTLARVTYDRSKAELGGRIFATPFVGIGDRNAVRRSRGLLTTAGGSQAAILAGSAGVPAVDLPSGRWSESSGLSVDLPVFNAAGEIESFKRVVVREGEAVRLDPGRGVVSFPTPEEQSWLVAMEEALTAYDRGADINALALWASGRLAALSAPVRAEFGKALVAEMETRSKTGVSPEHLERIKRVVASGGG